MRCHCSACVCVPTVKLVPAYSQHPAGAPLCMARWSSTRCCPAGRLLYAQAAPHVVALQAEYCVELLLSVSSAGTLLCMACWKRQTLLPSSSMWVAATAEAASTHHSCCAGSLEVGYLHLLRGTVTRSRAEFSPCCTHTDAELAGGWQNKTAVVRAALTVMVAFRRCRESSMIMPVALIRFMFDAHRVPKVHVLWSLCRHD